MTANKTSPVASEGEAHSPSWPETHPDQIQDLMRDSAFADVDYLMAPVYPEDADHIIGATLAELDARKDPPKTFASLPCHVRFQVVQGVWKLDRRTRSRKVLRDRIRYEWAKLALLQYIAGYEVSPGIYRQACAEELAALEATS